MLVRHVLSQLSYAPVSSLITSDVDNYTRKQGICQAFFQKFLKNFFTGKYLRIPLFFGKNQDN